MNETRTPTRCDLPLTRHVVPVGSRFSFSQFPGHPTSVIGVWQTTISRRRRWLSLKFNNIGFRCHKRHCPHVREERTRKTMQISRVFPFFFRFANQQRRCHDLARSPTHTDEIIGGKATGYTSVPNIASLPVGLL